MAELSHLFSPIKVGNCEIRNRILQSGHGTLFSEEINGMIMPTERHARYYARRAKGGIGLIRYPLVSDLRREISKSYGVLTSEGTALRALLLIDRQGTVRHAVFNDPALGRSVTETLRMLDAIRFHERHGKLCPADWQNGDGGVAPTQDGVIDYLSKFAKKKPMSK